MAIPRAIQRQEGAIDGNTSHAINKDKVKLQRHTVIVVVSFIQVTEVLLPSTTQKFTSTGSECTRHQKSWKKLVL